MFCIKCLHKCETNYQCIPFCRVLKPSKDTNFRLNAWAAKFCHQNRNTLDQSSRNIFKDYQFFATKMKSKKQKSVQYSWQATTSNCRLQLIQNQTSSDSRRATCNFIVFFVSDRHGSYFFRKALLTKKYLVTICSSSISCSNFLFRQLHMIFILEFQKQLSLIVIDNHIEGFCVLCAQVDC